MQDFFDEYCEIYVTDGAARGTPRQGRAASCESVKVGKDFVSSSGAQIALSG
jgi:hypothetical protein